MAVNTASPSDLTTMSPSKPRSARACDFCRCKKVRCEGGNPCKQCVDHLETCLISARKRGRKKPQHGQETVSQRLRKLESMLIGTAAEGTLGRETDTLSSAVDASSSRYDTVQNGGSDSLVDSRLPSECENIPLQGNPTPSQSSSLRLLDAEQVPLQPQIYQTSKPIETPQVSTLGQTAADHVSAKSAAAGTAASDAATDDGPGIHCAATLTEEHAESAVTSENSSLYCNEMTSWEYNGPRCILSICSLPGIQWMESNVKTAGVKESISRFAEDVTRRLKIESKPLLQLKERAPDPLHSVGRQYIDEFFARAFEAGTGLIDRTWFNSMIAAESNGTWSRHEDPSWYAIYYTVLAYGCRILSAKTQSYSHTVAASTALFENALSVQSDILQCRSSIISVRALILMAYYTEGIGSPHLEYMLTSNAMRLAISKGLHRQPAASWNVSEQEIGQRNWLFWNIYVLDRQISHRSGRPPAIDEDDISCQIPNTLSGEGGVHPTFTWICIKFHQILSHAYKRLSSARALRQSTAELVRAVTELDQEVTTLKQSIEHVISLDEPLDEFRISPNMPMFQVLMLYYLYYGVLFEIHSPLTVPWFDYTKGRRFETFRPQVEHSSAVVANTARAAIFATRFVRLDANCPVSLALFIPHMATIHLLTCILKAPKANTVHSDLRLMEIAVGYGSRVELASDGSISANFIRDFTRFASIAVNRANLQPPQHSIQCSETSEVLGEDLGGVRALVETESSLHDQIFFQEFVDPTFDMDMELWSSLVPFPSSEDIDANEFIANAR